MIVTDIPEHLWTLPKYISKPKRDVDNNSEPAVDQLKPGQDKAYEILTAYLMGELPGIVMVALQGYAGTGKTWVITQVFKYYIKNTLNRIAITAPTNKAVKVLRATANYEHNRIVYSTIHKLLGLKEQIDDHSGKQLFVGDFDADNDIKKVDALGIDETSMLQDEIYDMIKMETDRKIRSYDPANLKIIFLGDPVQIPPIGKTSCVPFNDMISEKEGIMTIRLENIIRQAEGNPILEVATLLRKHFQDDYVPYNRKTVVSKQGAVVMIKAADKEPLYKLCKLYFGSENFKKDADFVKVIAWTNKVVSFMNTQIRLMIYPEHVVEYVNPLDKDKPFKAMIKLVIGEKLIADSPIVDKTDKRRPRTQFTTNDEFEVVSFRIHEEKVSEDLTVMYYITKVEYIDPVTGEERYETINILHEDYEPAFNKAVAHLKADALKQPIKVRGMYWRNYYWLKNKYADVNYNYAITAHKSQGSTYDNAIVIAADIDNNRKVEERNRIKYVAFTRAKTNLFIVE